MGKVVLGFLPWIVYSALAGSGENGILQGAIIALAVALICGRKNLRKGFILDWCTVIFFVFVLVVGVYLRHSFVTQHPALFSNSALALIAIGSLLIGVPFTIQYAREQTPPEYWNSPIFKRINQVLTLTWGIAFALSALLSWLLPDNTYTVINIVLLTIAILMTVKFPDWYRNRALRS
jgi:ABC-type multidrug transport system permease subunit